MRRFGQPQPGPVAEVAWRWEISLDEAERFVEEVKASLPDMAMDPRRNGRR